MNWLKKHYHQIALVFWLVAVIPTVIWWKDSILWIAIMSLYANIWISVSVILEEK